MCASRATLSSRKTAEETNTCKRILQSKERFPRSKLCNGSCLNTAAHQPSNSSRKITGVILRMDV